MGDIIENEYYGSFEEDYESMEETIEYWEDNEYMEEDIDPEYANKENITTYYEYWDEESDQIEDEIDKIIDIVISDNSSEYTGQRKPIDKFEFIPMDIVFKILSFNELFVLRNGNIMSRFSKNDYRYKMIKMVPKKYSNPYENTTYTVMNINNLKKYVISVNNETSEKKLYIDIYTGFLFSKIKNIIKSIIGSVVTRIPLF